MLYDYLTLCYNYTTYNLSSYFDGVCTQTRMQNCALIEWIDVTLIKFTHTHTHE